MLLFCYHNFSNLMLKQNGKFHINQKILLLVCYNRINFINFWDWLTNITKCIWSMNYWLLCNVLLYISVATEIHIICYFVCIINTIIQIKTHPKFVFFIILIRYLFKLFSYNFLFLFNIWFYIPVLF